MQVQATNGLSEWHDFALQAKPALQIIVVKAAAIACGMPLLRHASTLPLCLPIMLSRRLLVSGDFVRGPFGEGLLRHHRLQNDLPGSHMAAALEP